MDQLVCDLIGKPYLKSGTIITIVAENFSLIQDQSRFLKAVLDIPSVKNIPLDEVCKRILQIGQAQAEIEKYVKKGYVLNTYNEHFYPSLSDKIDQDLMQIDRSLIFLNDAARFELLYNNPKEIRKFLRLVDKWKRVKSHFVIILYQNPHPDFQTLLLRNLEHMSDAVVRNRIHKTCYFQSMWHPQISGKDTLIPNKIETNYYTCKIGKHYWQEDVLCFYERSRVDKNHNPDFVVDKGHSGSINVEDEYEEGPSSGLKKLTIDNDDDEEQVDDNSTTLPYTRAQNPEQSRIFYYPDKEDDIDEDDPDNDLGF